MTILDGLLRLLGRLEARAERHGTGSAGSDPRGDGLAAPSRGDPRPRDQSRRRQSSVGSVDPEMIVPTQNEAVGLRYDSRPALRYPVIGVLN